MERTHAAYQLSFNTNLRLESASEIDNSSPRIATNIWGVSNLVEHLAACIDQNGHDADGGPNIAVRDDGQDVVASDINKGENTHGDRDARDPAHPVDRPNDFGVGALWDVSNEPRAYLFGVLRSKVRL